MATYVLIHGAGDESFHWHRLVPELTRRGHDIVAPDLPCDDDRAGFAEYTQTVLDAVGDRTDLIVVAQSLAGFTAPLVAERAPVRLLVFLNAMVPRVGEVPGEYWDACGRRTTATSLRPSDSVAVRPFDMGGLPVDDDRLDFDDGAGATDSGLRTCSPSRDASQATW